MIVIAAIAAALFAPAPFSSVARAASTGVQPEGRPIAAVQIQGLVTTPKQLVMNQIRSKVASPYDAQTVEDDIVRLTHLGRFSNVTATVQSLVNGSVVLTFHVVEQPLIKKIELLGNKAVDSDTLYKVVGLMPGDPASSFLIDRGKQNIIKAYQDQGYLVVAVTVDKKLLANKNIVKYKIREGPKITIVAIRFKGNKVFSDDELSSQIKSHAYFPILHSGKLSRKQLELDAASLRDYYRDRGYLDAQVGRRIELSPDQLDATVTFLIHEGKRYAVSSISVKGETIFSPAQVRNAMVLKPGDFVSKHLQDKSKNNILEMYGKLGYISTKVTIRRVFYQDQPKVDLQVTIDQGTRSTVGKIVIRGNNDTEKKVILRQIRGMTPGQPFDRQGIKQTQRRLSDSPLFSKAEVTVLGSPEDKVRDVLIDVKERRTGSISFGAGISSDSGLIGAITLVQKNFDIGDLPDDFGDLLSGDAFRGAGQYFSISIQPGTETSRYAAVFRDPYVFGTDYFLNTSVFYYTRELETYNDGRTGGLIGIGHRFGDVWSGQVNFNGQQVNISHIAADAPNDVYAVAGRSIVTSLGISMTRDTTNSSVFPTQGSRLTFGISQAGALGGDYNFTRAVAKYQQFWTVSEDFLGRKSVFSFRGQIGYIFQDDQAPIFERFFAGGRTFRGFDYRGVGPRGVRHDNGQPSDEANGGRFLLLAGLQYEFPLVSNVLRGVIFTDQGTVDTSASVSHWRVSIGAGLRIKLPFFRRAPFAIDFAIPIFDEEGDQTRLISFDLALPFR